MLVSTRLMQYPITERKERTIEPIIEEKPIGREFYINAIFKGNRKAYQNEKLEEAKKKFNFKEGVFNAYFHKGSDVDVERLKTMIGIVEGLARERASGTYDLVGKESLEATISDFEKKIEECARRANHNYSQISEKVNSGAYTSIDDCLTKKKSFWSRFARSEPKPKTEPVEEDKVSYWETYKNAVLRENGNLRIKNQIDNLEKAVQNFDLRYRTLLDHPQNPGTTLKELVISVRTLTGNYMTGSYSAIDSKAVLSIISDFEKKIEECAEMFGWDYKMPISVNTIFRGTIYSMRDQIRSDVPKTDTYKEGNRSAIFVEHNEPVKVEECLVKKGLFSRVKGFFGRK